MQWEEPGQLLIKGEVAPDVRDFFVHLRRQSADEKLGLRFQFQDDRAVVKDVHAGLVSSWNATVQRTGFQEHAVRPGDVAVCLNDRPFDEQALEQDCKQTLDIWFIFRGNREPAQITHRADRV